MKLLAWTLVLPLLAAPAFAQTSAADHAAHHPAAAASAGAAAAAMSDGEVRRVDKAGARLTLKHGEIRNLDMPPMTMVFQVKDASVLDKLKVGDKVRFKAAQENGKYTVTELQIVP